MDDAVSNCVMNLWQFDSYHKDDKQYETRKSLVSRLDCPKKDLVNDERVGKGGEELVCW